MLSSCWAASSTQRWGCTHLIGQHHTATYPLVGGMLLVYGRPGRGCRCRPPCCCRQCFEAWALPTQLPAAAAASGRSLTLPRQHLAACTVTLSTLLRYVLSLQHQPSCTRASSCCSTNHCLGVLSIQEPVNRQAAQHTAGSRQRTWDHVLGTWAVQGTCRRATAVSQPLSRTTPTAAAHRVDLATCQGCPPAAGAFTGHAAQSPKTKKPPTPQK